MSRGASPGASRGASPGTSLCGTAQRMSKPPMSKPVYCTRKMGLAWARGTAHCSTTRPLARYLTIDTSSIAIARRPIRCLENVAMPRISKFLSGFVGRSCFKSPEIFCLKIPGISENPRRRPLPRLCPPPRALRPQVRIFKHPSLACCCCRRLCWALMWLQWHGHAIMQRSRGIGSIIVLAQATRHT